MITINYAGRYGNKMIQYFIATIFSHKFKKKIQNPLDCNIIKKYFFSEKNFETVIEVNNRNFFEIYNRNSLESEIFINDFFQTKEIISFLDKNRFHINEYQSKNNNDLFVHVRLGDLLHPFIGTGNRFMDLEYYDNIIQNLKFDKGFISSDSPTHPIVEAIMSKYGLHLYEGSPEETINYGSLFEYKVLSLGTFSWWIGFLNNQNNIFFPNPNNYPIWHGDIFIFENWNKV